MYVQRVATTHVEVRSCRYNGEVRTNGSYSCYAQSSYGSSP